MTNEKLPLLGAAMTLASVPQHLDWLNEGGRALEIQDPTSPEVLDGDLKTIIQNARTLLGDFHGKLGIHGPFRDLTLASDEPKIKKVVIERLHQGLDFAHEIGATHMVMHSP